MRDGWVQLCHEETRLRLMLIADNKTAQERDGDKGTRCDINVTGFLTLNLPPFMELRWIWIYRSLEEGVRKEEVRGREKRERQTYRGTGNRLVIVI